MKYILAIDSYKGCMTAEKACEFAMKGIKRADPQAECILLPLADGGEGTASAMAAAMGGEVRECRVTGPFGHREQGYFGILKDPAAKVPELIVIDTAAASGLGLAKKRGLDPMRASSYGTGEQIAKALDTGCKNIIVGLGGSGTNDGGCGALAALGGKFYDKDGNLLDGRSGGSLLEKIYTIDLSELHHALKTAKLRLMFDVAIPLTGEDGCSLNYSAQKGADKATMLLLEAGMSNYAAAIMRSLSLDPNHFPGAGAAGGLGCGLMLAGGQLVEGAPFMLETAGFHDKAASVDLVITGEGRTDVQTASGKLPVAVAKAAKAFGKPVVCVCGSAEPTEAIYESGIDAVFSIAKGPMKLEDALRNGPELLENLCYNIAGFFVAAANK